MAHEELNQIPFGAVYFRKSNPPKEDWSTDYRTASEDGMNTFRHWFLWSAVEVAPGEWDWSDYDRQLDLAAENGLKTIIAEMMTAAPEWAFRAYAHARFERRNGSKVNSGMSGSCSTGGFPGLCLDNEDVLTAAGTFLKTLVGRYKDHPGLGGYDIWNECNIGADLCYCPATAAKFRAWLQEKYGDLKTLGQAWYRHSFADWEDINPPRDLGAYPHTLDWLQFRVDNAYKLMRWRAEIVRTLDPNHRLAAHGVAASLSGLAPRAADDWQAAAEVDSYGYTWGSSRHGDQPWKQWHAVDLVRASARGKPFWHAESYGGPLWMQQQVVGKPRHEGRIARPQDIRLWKLQSMAAGATGFMFLRWRPLLDGPLFGAFGPYGMDGSRTERSQMGSRVAKWANDSKQAPLFQSRPVKGDVGIVFVPESQMHAYAQQGQTTFFTRCMQGAYQGFFANNVQADWVHIDHIDEYDFLYLPFPAMLKEATVKLLTSWVEKGGTLVSEGCPAYFGDRGRVGTVQPNYGLDALFGARESYVEFTPDILEDLFFHVDGVSVRGGLYLQAYEPTTGEAVGWYPDGRVAAVDHTYGKGRTRLVGTFPSAGFSYSHGEGPLYGEQSGTEPGGKGGSVGPESDLTGTRWGTQAAKDSSRQYFGALLSWAGKEQHLRVSDPRVTARIHAGNGGTYLWVLNPTESELSVVATVSEAWGPFNEGEAHWGMDDTPTIDGHTVRVRVGGRDAAVLKLG